MPQRKQKPLVVEYVPIEVLRPDPLNPRRHPARQLKQLTRNIETFGFNVPILLDQANNVVAGHCRADAARRAGHREVPVIRLEHLTETEVRAFRIADNRLAELATWDDQSLGEILGELASLELHFDLEVIGFSTTEIDLRIEVASAEADSEGKDADNVPEIPQSSPVTRPGDLWQLDRHWILCADALDEAGYVDLLAGKPAAMVFADPPYNVRIDGHVCGKGQIHHREFAMASGEMTEAQFAQFLASALRLMARHSTSGSLHYICMDWRHLLLLLGAGQQVYRELMNLCVWVKTNAGMGSFYRSGHEMIAVFKNGRAAHRNNIELGRFGRNRSNVWSYPSVNGFSQPSEEDNLLAIHPTIKPVAMIADAILDCTARGDLVLDPFLGSGSTLIAAQRVGRPCRAMEIDPRYIDTAIRRWERFTGGTAIHARTGEPFGLLEQRLENQHG